MSCAAVESLPFWEGADGLERADILEAVNREELIATTTHFGCSVGKYTMTRSMLMYMYPSHQAKIRLQYHSPYS